MPGLQATGVRNFLRASPSAHAAFQPLCLFISPLLDRVRYSALVRYGSFLAVGKTIRRVIVEGNMVMQPSYIFLVHPLGSRIMRMGNVSPWLSKNADNLMFNRDLAYGVEVRGAVAKRAQSTLLDRKSDHFRAVEPVWLGPRLALRSCFLAAECDHSRRSRERVKMQPAILGHKAIWPACP